MIKEIITDYDAVSTTSDEIDARKDGKLTRQIVIDLKDTIREHNLNALSAIQIGYDKRIFVINFNGDLKSYVNPLITNVKGFEMSKESDASIPDKKYILPRYNTINVVYQTPMGVPKSGQFVGMSAKVFQQMQDHLEGILISDLGLEIDEDFENASEDEQAEIIKMYLDSLDIRRQTIEQEIAEDEDLSKLKKNLDIRDKIISGEMTITPIKEGESDNAEGKNKKKSHNRNKH